MCFLQCLEPNIHGEEIFYHINTKMVHFIDTNSYLPISIFDMTGTS